MVDERELSYRLVRHKVVHVVTALPPSNRQTTAEISNKHANKSVDDKIRRNRKMASIMRAKHDLMLPKLVQSFHTHDKESDIPRTIPGTQQM